MRYAFRVPEPAYNVMTVQIMSPVALDLRNELHSDPVSALATQLVYEDCDCDRVTACTLLHEVAFWQRTMASFFGFVFILDSTNVEL